MTQPASWRAPHFLTTSAQRDLWNALLSYREQALIPAGYNVSFRFSMASPPDAMKPALLVKPENGPSFVAVIDNFPFEQMFGVELALQDVLSLPAPLRACLEEGVVSTIWQAVPRSAGLGPLRILNSGPVSEIAADARADDELQWLLVTIEGVAPAPVTVLTGFSVAAFEHVVSKGVLAQSAISRGLQAAIATDVYYTIGNIIISYQNMTELDVGDLIVLPHLAEGQIWARAQDVLFTMQRASDHFICTNRELVERYRRSLTAFQETTTMKEDTSDAIDVPGSIGELDVIIDFDIGRTAVTLSDLQAWQPGTALLIEPPALNDNLEVTVRANGQVVGIGDLVRIDDRLAVRLTRLTFKK